MKGGKKKNLVITKSVTITLVKDDIKPLCESCAEIDTLKTKAEQYDKLLKFIFKHFPEETVKMGEFLQPKVKKGRKNLQELSENAKKILGICREMKKENKIINWAYIMMHDGWKPEDANRHSKSIIYFALQSLEKKGFLRKLRTEKLKNIGNVTNYEMV